MLFHTVLSVLSLLLCHYSWVVNGALSMTKWSLPGSQNIWNVEPTWHAETPAQFLQGGGQAELDYSWVLEIAHQHYNWLQGQENSKTYKGACMVAALWDPNSRKVYASSIPQGARKRTMTSESKYNGRAPVWYNIVRPFMGYSSNPPLHAEDGVFFNWETSGGTQMTNGHYPAGSIIAVWGKYATSGTDREISLCKTEASRNPTCQAVAEALGVRYKGDVQQTPQQAQEDNSPDEFGDVLTDAQWDEYMRDLCTTGGHSKRLAIGGTGPVRRDNTTCILFPFPSDVPASTVSMTLPSTDLNISTSPITTGSTTAGPSSTPSCSMQDEDPDQGIFSACCVCDQNLTLPFLSAASTAIASESCQYTTIPTLLPTITNGLGPATTDMKSCQVCTPIVNNEDSCTSLDGCIVQTGAVTVQAGSSPVHVGTLTSTELYTKVSNALQTLCPSATQTTSMTACSTGSVTVQGVPYVDGGFLEMGELVISVESSQYNVTSLRDAMIQSAALTAQSAATGKNCYDQKYNVESLKARADIPLPYPEHATWCNTVGFAGVNYYNPYWRVQQSPGATDWIDARWSFSTGPGGSFTCGLLEGLIDAFAIVAPEFAVGDIELGDAVDLVCEQELSRL